MKMRLHVFIRIVKAISPLFCGAYDSASPENFFLPLESGHTIKVLPTRGSVRPIKKTALKCSMVTKRGPPCSSLLCLNTIPGVCLLILGSLFGMDLPYLVIVTWRPAFLQERDWGRERERHAGTERMRKTERTQEGQMKEKYDRSTQSS